MPKILKIIKNPDPVLRRISKNIDEKIIKTNEFKKFCADMSETLLKKDGVGLAAPQVGKNIRMFVINTKDGVQCFINPKIIKKSILKEWSEEGCLSIPFTFGKLKRHKKVVCECLDENGEKTTIEANGLMAIAIQHENDHLDGILFIDKAKEIKKEYPEDAKN